MILIYLMMIIIYLLILLISLLLLLQILPNHHFFLLEGPIGHQNFLFILKTILFLFLKPPLLIYLLTGAILYISFSLSNTHHALISHVSSLVEPTSYTDAITNPNWIQAMDNELAALAANKTWEVVPLPHGNKPIGCKWVFKVKLKLDGTLERYKVRLVAKGYTQQYGVDFQEKNFPGPCH